MLPALRFRQQYGNRAHATSRQPPLPASLPYTPITYFPNNAKSLDDALRLFNREYATGGKTFTDADIIPIIERATGTKLQEFYSRYINGRDPLPFDELIRRAGFRCEKRSEEVAVLGATVEQDDKGWKVLEITPDGSAAAMGLKVGDIVTSINFMGQNQSLAEIPSIAAEQVLQQLAYPGIGFGVIRDGSEIVVKVKRVTRTEEMCDIAVDPDASGLPAAVRAGLFGK